MRLRQVWRTPPSLDRTLPGSILEQVLEHEMRISNPLFV